MAPSAEFRPAVPAKKSYGRAPPLVQVEYNAPLKDNSVIEAPAAEPDAPNAVAAAKASKAAAVALIASEKEKLAKFRQATLERLRAKAQAGRDAAAAIEASEAAKKAEAVSAGVIQRAALPAAPPPAAKALAEPPASEPSQLMLMRAGLSDQALGARDLMLARCELPMPPEVEPMAMVDISEPPPPEPAATAGELVKFAPPKPTTSVLRAVTTTAARADRHAAREAREKKKGEERKAIYRAHLAKAVFSAREAAERDAKVRQEVAQLELEVAAREEEAAVAQAMAAEELRHKKRAESERYFEALREQLRGEAARAKRPLPPLCSCGLDPLENHTEQCSRNCVFYNNPAAYGRALSGLFVRPIVLD